MTESTPTRLLLVGGTSEIGLAIVRRMATRRRVAPYLLGRDSERLLAATATLEAAGCASADVDVIDARDLGSHGEIVGRAFRTAGGFDAVIIATGVLGAQTGLDAEPEVVAEVMDVNFVGSGSLLWHCLRCLRDQGSGTMIVLSSVSAERPRAGNAIYGAAKAGLDALAQGLSDAVAGSGAHVMVVRPGHVKTRMTAGLKPPPFATTPEAVAEATLRGLDRGRHTVWVPGQLRYVFAVIRHLPRNVYRRLPV